MTRAVVILTALMLAGCGSQAVRLEENDHAECQRIVAQRGDTSPGAYDRCRANLIEHRKSIYGTR